MNLPDPVFKGSQCCLMHIYASPYFGQRGFKIVVFSVIKHEVCDASMLTPFSQNLDLGALTYRTPCWGILEKNTQRFFQNVQNSNKINH